MSDTICLLVSSNNIYKFGIFLFFVGFFFIYLYVCHFIYLRVFINISKIHPRYVDLTYGMHLIPFVSWFGFRPRSMEQIYSNCLSFATTWYLDSPAIIWWDSSYSSFQFCVCVFFPVSPMLPVSLNCLLLVAPFVFSDVYLVTY